MPDYTRERKLKKKREYYRKWRAEHPEAVKASQVRYWTKKAQEAQNTTMHAGTVEIRNIEV